MKKIYRLDLKYNTSPYSICFVNFQIQRPMDDLQKYLVLRLYENIFCTIAKGLKVGEL